MITLREAANVNREYLAKDESHLFPIRNKFNVTKRAIRNARLARIKNECYDEIEYRALLDSEISKIVNDEQNW